MVVSTVMSSIVYTSFVWFVSIVITIVFCVPVNDIYVYLYCCDDFCGERGCYVSLFLSWIVVLIDPTNCLKSV